MVTTQIDTFFYDLSIPAISSLQERLSDHAPMMQSLSVIFDPKYAFLIYSPIAYLLDKNVGKKLIMTTVIAEWLNQVLKWLLHGERPYWYVHSSGHFDAKQVPISQFPVTCELGPGHPSGHAMVTSAVWYVILNSLLQAYINYRKNNMIEETRNATITGNNNNYIDDVTVKSAQLAMYNSQELQQSHLRKIKLVTWLLYFGLIAAVSVSRVFLGCHFPHQCLAGAALGLLLARRVCSYETKPAHYVAASGILFGTAFGTFFLMQAFGFDPAWTIQLAMKHCAKREYIHLDTAPFFSIMRYCGFALGCGLGLLYPLRKLAGDNLVALPSTQGGVPSDDLIDLNSDDSYEEKIYGKSMKHLSDMFTSRAISWLSAKILMALVMARLSDNLGLFVSHSNMSVFYSAAFVVYTLFSYAIINL